MGLVEVACVIASNNTCGGIEKIKALGIPIHVVNPKSYPDDKTGFGNKLLRILVDDYNVDAVGQHGWMPITPSNVIARFPGKMLNQHPGPLDPGHADFGGVNPGMFGARVSCARLYYCRTIGADYWTEATAHIVTEGVDEGLLVHTERVPIEPSDDVASLQARLLPSEHRVCIEAWRLMATGKANPHLRESRLISKQRSFTLQEAKRIAKTLYPKG